MSQQHQNPFVHINLWVKGEVWCLDALQKAINTKNKFDHMKHDADKEIASLTKTINKLHVGKFTFGAMFKSEGGKKEDKSHFSSFSL